MWNDVKQIKSNEDTVSKFIFTKEDDIGAGCGMLWLVQKWMKENRK